MANDAATADDPVVSERDEAFAASGLYPNRSPCPVGCKFCYERSLPEFYPKLKVARVRPKSLKQFEFYSDKLTEYNQSAIPTAPVLYDPASDSVVYHSYSDFFAQGLTLEQLDRVVGANTTAGAAPYLSTMGKGFDLSMAKHLQAKHPDAFRVRLSVLTYNDDIKATLIPRWTADNEMREITSVLRYAHVYLLHFNFEQTLKDLRECHELANREHKPNVGIAVVHYTRLHPPIVQKYAEDAFRDFEQLIRYLASGKESFPNFGEISFQHPAEGFTFRFRNWLRMTLAPHLLGPDDLVVCSKGAYDVMNDLVVRTGATLMPVRDSLGGSTSFTTTLQTDDFLRDVKAKLEKSERPFKRIFVPACVWWVANIKCLGGGTLDDVRASFPDVEIVPIDIPMDIQEARLSVRQAYEWYNADLPATRTLLGTPEGIAKVRACLAPNEELTETGFVRRMVSGDDGSIVVSVEYDELLVEKSDEPKPHDNDGEMPPPVRFNVGDGEGLIVRRTLVRRYPLDEETHPVFRDLFVVKKPLVDDGDASSEIARQMYLVLADLELRRH